MANDDFNQIIRMMRFPIRISRKAFNVEELSSAWMSRNESEVAESAGADH